MSENGPAGGRSRRKILLALLPPVALVAGAVLLVFSLGVFGGREPGMSPSLIRFRIPSGASFREVADTLQARSLVKSGRAFTLFARLKRVDREVRSGPYALPPGTPWSEILRHLTEGRVLIESLTIPEGFRLAQMAPRIGEITGMDPDSVLSRLTADSAAPDWEVPGPGLEGYLFPDTYRLARGAPLREVLAAMVERYREFWTPVRVARRDSMGLTERQVVTMASIIQAEARVREEMPLISSVYHNRLARGQLLQADPTVLYALGGYRPRLLYAAMDSVADHPYNTYTHSGLPPGPIGAPGEEALEAALHPAETDYHYFVARPDGTHVFSETLAEHNRAVARLRPQWEQYRREQQGSGRDGP